MDIVQNEEQYASKDNPINTIVPEVASSVTGRELITPGTEPEKQNKMKEKKISQKYFSPMQPTSTLINVLIFRQSPYKGTV